MKYKKAYLGLLITFLISGVTVYIWWVSKIGYFYKIGNAIEYIVALMIIPCFSANSFPSNDNYSLYTPPTITILGVLTFYYFVKDAHVSVAAFVIFYALIVQVIVYFLFNLSYKGVFKNLN